MPIDFGRPSNSNVPSSNVPAVNDDIEVKEYNIQTDRQQVEIKLKDSKNLMTL